MNKSNTTLKEIILNKYCITIVVITYFLNTSNSFAQSKKELIQLQLLKIDSLNSILNNERDNCKKEKEILYFDIQNLKTEKVKLYNDNEQLVKETKVYKLKNEAIESKLKKLEDSLNQSNNYEIISFLIREDVVLYAGPVIQVDYAVLQISAKVVKGFVGWASQGEAEYYISGNFIDDSYIGDVFQIGSNQAAGKFQLKIKDLKLNLIGDARVDHNEIPMYNGLHFFHGGALTNLLSFPSFNSKEIMSKSFFDINNSKGSRILEIGKYDQLNGEYNLWYKVQIEDKIGWIFGGLCTVCSQ